MNHTPNQLREKAEQLAEVAEKMYELWQEANDILHDTHLYDQAKAYTLAHLKIGITQDHGYATRDTSLGDLAEQLEEAARDDLEALRESSWRLKSTGEVLSADDMLHLIDDTQNDFNDFEEVPNE